MFEAMLPASGRRLRTTVLLVVATALLALGVMGSTQLTAKANACSGGALCLFGGSHWGSFYANHICSVPFGAGFPTAWSAKNNCGNNIRMGWNESGFVNWKFCMAPGGERDTPCRLNYACHCL